MFKSLIYKEWIKTRWFIAGFLLLGIIAIAMLYLKTQHDFKFSEAKNIWNGILFKNYSYFSSLKFLPLLCGAILGISQYVPEIIDKRIKLTYHLPMNENKILLQMMGYGTLVLMVCFSVLITLFWTISAFYFPKEIISDAMVTITPWFLSGFAAYFLIGFIVLEPVWRYRLYYTIVSAFFITLFLYSGMNGAYISMNLTLTICTIASSIALLFSGYRFRKGEQ